MSDDGTKVSESEAIALAAKHERNKLAVVSLLIIAAVALGAAAVFFRSVAIPFVMAVFLSYLVSPLVDFLQMRARLPRWLAMILTLTVTTGIMLGIVALFAQSITGLADKADLYRERLALFGAGIGDFLAGFGVQLDAEQVQGYLSDLPLQEWVTGAVGSIADFVSNAILTLLFFIFLVAGANPWEERGGVWDDIDLSVNRYLRVKFITSLAIGLGIGLTLWAFGVELAFVFGIIGFLLNFVPTVGSILAVVLTLPVVFVTVEPTTGLACVGIIVVIQNVIGNGLEPTMMGTGLDLHPATVLLGLSIWGSLWGIVGMLLSAPLMAIIKIVMARYATTRPFAEALAGRLGAQARVTNISL